MNEWLELGLSNAVVATGLALVAWGVTRICRRPQVAALLWSLVLVKLLMPPLSAVPWSTWRIQLEPAASAPTEEQSLALAAVPPPVNAAGMPGVPVLEAGEASVPLPPAVDPPNAAVAKTVHLNSPAVEIPRNAPPVAAAWRLPSLPSSAALGELALLAWLSGSLAWIALAAYRMGRFGTLVQRAALADAGLQAEVVVLAAAFGLRRKPEVRLHGGRLTPLVWTSLRRSTILLPRPLLERLSPEERRSLLAHEVAHVARRDGWLRWLELAAVACYWWHPVAWWARRGVSEAAEQCCDAAVLRVLPEVAAAYARTLLAAVEYSIDGGRSLPAGASGFSQARFLKRRMEMILQNRGARDAGRLLRLSLLGLAIVALPVSLRVAGAAQNNAAGSKSIEARLERLEKAVAALTAEVRALNKVAADSAPPKVIKAVPDNGDKDVDPSTKEIRVTFSKPMQDGSWSWTQRSDDTFPEVVGKIHYLEDGKTCVLPVKLQPGKKYYLSINSRRFKNFTDKQGNPAVPYPLEFETKK